MTDEVSQKLALLADKMEGRVCEGETAEDRVKWVMKAATDVGFDGGSGSIVWAGRDVDGAYRVQFRDENDKNYLWQWPVWAYEIALSALVNRKEVGVFWNGEPLGENLVYISISELDV